MNDLMRQASVPQPARQFLEVSLVKPGHIPISARLLELTHCAANLQVNEFTDPGLALGERVELHFQTPQLSEPLGVEAVVRFRRDLDRGSIYRFEFVDWKAFRETIPPQLRPTFNQRVADRLPLRPGKPIDVALQTPAEQGDDAGPSGALRDLSEGGLSIWVEHEVEQALRMRKSVRVSLVLPGDQIPVTFQGAIRYRQQDDDGLWLGIAFNPEETLEFERQLRQVCNFLEQHRESLLAAQEPVSPLADADEPVSGDRS